MARNPWETMGFGFLLLGLGTLLFAIQLAGRGVPDHVQIWSTLASVSLAAGGTSVAYAWRENRQQRRLVSIVLDELEQTIEILRKPKLRGYRMEFGKEDFLEFGLAPIFDFHIGKAAELEALDKRARRDVLFLAAKIRSYGERLARLQDTISQFVGGIQPDQVPLLRQNLSFELDFLREGQAEILKIADALKEQLQKVT